MFTSLARAVGTPTWLRTLFLLAGLFLAIVAGASETAGHLRVSAMLARGQPVKIVCFGDSITGVYYHTGSRRSWCDLLGIALSRIYPQAKVEMINAGVGGNDTRDALKRLDHDVLQPAPQLVIVMLGMNDVRSQTTAVFRANLETIVQKLRGVGAEVILMTPNAVGADDNHRTPARVAEYVQVVRDVGQGQNVPVVDTYTVFAKVLAADPAAWQRLMSDTIHPNLRGHRIFAEEVARFLTGRSVSLAELPTLHPGLPSVLARLQARQTVHVIAMPPYDQWIGLALRKHFPDAVVEVTTWQPDAHSLAAIAAQAKEIGWWKFHRDPSLQRPDLVVLAVPATAQAPTAAEFYHAYFWIMDWSLSFGKTPAHPEWDVLCVLPSVAQEGLDKKNVSNEEEALTAIGGQDIPWLSRQPKDSRNAVELLSEALGALLALESKNSNLPGQTN